MVRSLVSASIISQPPSIYSGQESFSTRLKDLSHLGQSMQQQQQQQQQYNIKDRINIYEIVIFIILGYGAKKMRDA